jgi:hypothetical protein
MSQDRVLDARMSRTAYESASPFGRGFFPDRCCFSLNQIPEQGGGAAKILGKIPTGLIPGNKSVYARNLRPIQCPDGARLPAEFAELMAMRIAGAD